MKQRLAQHIADLVEPILADEGYEFVHLELVGPHRQMTLRLYIDKPGGVTIDDCADVSKLISVWLDVQDPIPDPYHLEVCSPGVERGLYKKADYQRFAGQETRIRTTEPFQGRRTFHGELLGISGDTITIRERILGQDVRIPYQHVQRANLVFDWGKGKQPRR